jgi:hypothetical protein
MSDLAKAVDNVVSTLKQADEVVKSAMAVVASSGGGLTDTARGDLTEKLEAKAWEIEESIKGKFVFRAPNRPRSVGAFN